MRPFGTRAAAGCRAARGAIVEVSRTTKPSRWTRAIGDLHVVLVVNNWLP
jgi:hypothetical protein